MLLLLLFVGAITGEDRLGLLAVRRAVATAPPAGDLLPSLSCRLLVNRRCDFDRDLERERDRNFLFGLDRDRLRRALLCSSSGLSEDNEELRGDLDRERDLLCFVVSRPYLSGRCLRSAITFRTS